MMTLDEARAAVGQPVVYSKFGAADFVGPEYGIITSVGDPYVFVRYGTDTGSKATYPTDLTLT